VFQESQAHPGDASLTAATQVMHTVHKAEHICELQLPAVELEAKHAPLVLLMLVCFQHTTATALSQAASGLLLWLRSDGMLCIRMHYI
jgi:hypothetical protein